MFEVCSKAWWNCSWHGPGTNQPSWPVSPSFAPTCTNYSGTEAKHGSKARKQSEAKRSKAHTVCHNMSQSLSQWHTMEMPSEAQDKSRQCNHSISSTPNAINLKSTKRHIFVADFDWFCNLQDSVPSNRVRNGISFWPCFTVVDLWGSNRRFLPNIPVLQIIPKVLDTLLMENVRCNLYCLHCEKFFFFFHSCFSLCQVWALLCACWVRQVSSRRILDRCRPWSQNALHLEDICNQDVDSFIDYIYWLHLITV